MPHIGLLSIHLHIPSSQSLKAKRWVLKSLKDRIHSKFNVSMAEVDDLDKWQSAVFAVCMVSADKIHVDRNLQAVLSFFAAERDVELLNHQVEFF